MKLDLRRTGAPIILLFILSILPTGSVGAQEVDEWASPRMWAGGALAVAQPHGEFNDYVDLGIGITGFFRVAFDEGQLFSLRIEGSALTYGNERQRVCLVQPCLVQVDLVTSNNILSGFIGPEIAIPIADAVRLSGMVGGGFSHFATTSRVEDQRDQETIASDQNFSDFGWAWKAGGGSASGSRRAGPRSGSMWASTTRGMGAGST